MALYTQTLFSLYTKDHKQDVFPAQLSLIFLLTVKQQFHGERRSSLSDCLIFAQAGPSAVVMQIIQEGFSCDTMNYARPCENFNEIITKIDK
jgi:hypothetical protein